MLAAAVEPGTPARISARAPITQPPTGDSGKTSEPASRSSRADKKAQIGRLGASPRHASPMTAIRPRWIRQIAANPRHPMAVNERSTAPAPNIAISAAIAASPVRATTIGMTFMRPSRHAHRIEANASPALPAQARS